MLLFVDREPIPFSGRGVFFYLTAGFFTAFLGRVLLNAGIRKIGSSRAAAIKNAAPLFTILIAVSLIGERITYGAALGMVVILAALAFQAKHDFSRSEMLDGRNKYWGFFLALASAAAFGIGQASRKEGVIHYADPVFGSLIGSAFALIVFVIMELVQKRFHETVTNNFRRINVHFILAGVLTGIAQVSFFSFADVYPRLLYERRGGGGTDHHGHFGKLVFEKGGKYRAPHHPHRLCRVYRNRHVSRR